MDYFFLGHIQENGSIFRNSVQNKTKLKPNVEASETNKKSNFKSINTLNLPEIHIYETVYTTNQKS